MQRVNRAVSILIAAVFLAGLAASAEAQAFLYAGKRKKINCGVAVVDSTKQPLTAGMDANGYPATNGGVGDLFYLLDMRTDMKPPGWSFENPLAPYDPTTKQRPPKSSPLYWQVDLQSDPDLSRMHVLYLPAYGTVKLTSQEREALRKFVDGGGVLWIDNGSFADPLSFCNTAEVTDPGTFFILYFKFMGSLSDGSDYPVSRHHPLLTLPFWLTDWDIANLGVNPGKSVCIAGYDPGGGGRWRGTSEPENFDVLYPVVGNTSALSKSRASVAANAYGSGRVVATSTYVGRGCFYNNSASLKFAYNVIAWSSTWTHLRKDPRHSGGSIDTVGGTKLVDVWSLPVGAGNSASSIGNAPVIYKNIVFYTTGSRVWALDLLGQEEDLDHDGNPDDGFQDDKGAADYDGQDVVWYFDEPDGANLSPPSIVTMQNPAGPNAPPLETVLVKSASGKVYMLAAFPVDDALRFVGTAQDYMQFLSKNMPPPWPTGVQDDNPGPPLYVNGWIYTTSSDGCLHAYSPPLEAWANANDVDAKDAHFHWEIPTNDAYVREGQTANARTGPSFGYVTSDTSGATVGMVYWFTTAWVKTDSAGTPVAGQEQNDYVCGVPVYVANDRVKFVNVSQDKTKAQYRIAYRGMISNYPTPVAYVRKPDGTDQVANVEPNKILQGNAVIDQPAGQMGNLIVDIPAGSAATWDTGTMVRVTYALEYASGEGVNYFFRPSARQGLQPSSNVNNGVPPTTIKSMPAMGPENMIFLAGERGGGSDPPAVYGVKSDGTAQLSRWIYLLHGSVDPSLATGHMGSQVEIPGVVYDATTFRSIVSPQVYSSPAVAQDKVFVTVSGDVVNGPDGKPDTGTPTAALLCFKADSDFVVRITERGGLDSAGRPLKNPKSLINPVNGQHKRVKLWQPNLMDSGPPPTIPLQTAREARSSVGVTIDYNKGALTFDHFDKMKLLGQSRNSAGQPLVGVYAHETNCFSPSLPVYVYLDDVEVPIDWSTWAPAKALWEGTHPATDPLPVPAGDSVDLSGWNNLLWFFTVPPHPVPGSDDKVPCSGIHSSPVVIGSNVYFVCDDGYIYSYPTEPGETSGGPADSKLLVWEGKISESAPTPFARGPVGQKKTDAPSLSVAGSNGVLLVPTPDGLHAYTNATTLVADANRLVETDGAGEIKWTLSSVTWPVSAPKGNEPAMTSGPINKPSRAKYLPSGEILMVNSASNQVCRIDKSGTAGLGGLLGKYIRAVYDKFVDPKNLLRPGQPTYLSSPTDALFWQDYEKQQDSTWMRVDHCVIADSGNHRVMDLVYRFKLDAKTGAPTELVTADRPGSQPDPATGFYLPELNWVTVTDSMNERYVYECIQLVPGTYTGPDGSTKPCQDIYAAVSNYRGDVPGVESEGLGGAIFALRYRVMDSGVWDYAVPDAGRIAFACDRILDPTGKPVPLACPRYVQIIDRPMGRFMLICDNYGVYEVGPTGGGAPRVTRSFRDADYRAMLRDMKDFDTGGDAGAYPLRMPLVASSVQELMNGDWLITNSYSGTVGVDFGPPVGIVPKTFSGEAFEISWNSDGTVKKVEWSSPYVYVLTMPDPNDPTKKISQWDTWKQRLENSYILQQPRSAVRQM